MYVCMYVSIHLFIHLFYHHHLSLHIMNVCNLSICINKSRYLPKTSLSILSISTSSKIYLSKRKYPSRHEGHFLDQPHPSSPIDNVLSEYSGCISLLSSNVKHWTWLLPTRRTTSQFWETFLEDCPGLVYNYVCVR